MKNATLKDLMLQIILITFITIVMLLVELFTEEINIFNLLGIIFCIIIFLVFGLRRIIRYKYVKRICYNSELIDGVIVKKGNSKRMHYYDIKVQGTNTVLTTSTIFGMFRNFEIGDEVVICYDEKNKEAIIVWGPLKGY